MTTLKGLVIIAGYVLLAFVRFLFASLMDGAFVFLGAMAVVGFIAWVVGVENVRVVAMRWAMCSGGVWAVAHFAYKYGQFIVQWRRNYTNALVKEIEEGEES